MQANENRGTTARHDDNVPVHQTQQFKETVKKVKSGQDVAPTQASQSADDFALRHPDFKINVPLPTSVAPLNAAGHPRKISHGGDGQDNARTDQYLHEIVKAKVIKQAPLGFINKLFDPKGYDAAIEKETQRIVDTIKKPRYVMLSDNTPFYLDKADERADLAASMVNVSPVKRVWTMAKYDIAAGVETLGKFISTPATRTKEFITDINAKGNVAGAVAQLGLNSVILGWEYLKAGDQSITATEEKAKALEQQAAAVKYTDPAAAEALAQQAAEMHKGAAAKQKYQDDVQLASKAVDSAWVSLFTEWDEAKQQDKEARAALGPGATPDAIMEYTRQQRYKEEAAARETAASFRTQAATEYGKGNYDKAIALTEQAQQADRNSRLADPQGAYTWIREPDRYAKFKKDAALLELQKGAPLSDSEIRRLKEYHANSWTETTGEMIFDPVNFIPAPIMEKVFEIPMSGAKILGKAALEIPGVAKTTHVLGTPVRWLLRESVNSGATRIMNTTYNILSRVSNGYVGAEEVTKALDEISVVVLDGKRALNETEARQIFEAGRQKVPGLQQITFSDFKKLMDAGDHIDPTQWGKMYSDSLTVAEQNLIETATKSGKPIEDVASDISKNRWALEDYSQKFYKAFKDPHRIFKGSRLTDDTVAGWITKKLRAMTGDDLNEAMKLTGNDEWLLARSEKMGTVMKPFLQKGTHLVEASLTFAAQVRDIWATAVLTTFRWPINNLADSSMRSVVYGGNLWDDMVTLFTSTQRTLADELGIAPIEFNQALSRQELKFTESVPHRLLYEGWKPKAGLFSYVGYEYKRLLAEHGDEAIAKATMWSNMVDKMPEGILKRGMTGVADGLSYRVNYAAAIKSLSGGISDFNTAIEFTLRLRMFHREYFSLLEKLEPQFVERGMEALNPATKEIAKQIWKAAEGNPRKMTAYVDNLLGGAAKTPAKWSFVVPPEMDQVLKGMSATDQHLFMGAVKNELDEFIATSARAGKDLQPEDFKNFFEDYKVKMQDEIQARLAAAHDLEGADVGIKTDGKPNNVLTENDVQGAMPKPKDTSPQAKKIEDAIGDLKRKGKRRSTIDINNDFETAVSSYAKVQRVSGDGIRVRRVGTDLIVEVGDNALKKTSGKFYNDINEAVMGILKFQDTDAIRATFKDLDAYDATLRKFLANPTDVLNEHEQGFLLLVNQMENHPELRTIIEQTSPKTVLNYDSAMDVYRQIGEYSDEYGFNKPLKEIFETEAQKKRPIPGSHIAAQSHSSALTRQLADLGRSVDPAVGDHVRQIVDNFTTYRQELKQFYAFTYPGPLMNATTEGARHSGWDLFYRLSEAEFVKESELKTKLIELIQKDPAEAAKFMDETNKDFGTWFLQQNGIELTWDADRQSILNIKVTGLDGRARNYAGRQDIALLQSRFFTPKTQAALEGLEPLRIGAENIKNDLKLALRNTFEIDTSTADAWSKVIDAHAQKWAQETGQPIEKYYERLGFQRVDSASAKGLPTLDRTRMVKRGAVGRLDNGQFMFYGLSHSNFESMVRETSELFFDDLASMAEHSPQAADDFKELKAFLEEKTGKKIRGNVLQKDHSIAMSDYFSSYIATGHGPNIKIKGGFDRMRAWMTQTFDAVKDSSVPISDMNYRILDRMFIESKITDVPKTNARVIRQMAIDADLIATDEPTLLKIINDNLAQPVMDEAQKTQRAALEAESTRLEQELHDLTGGETFGHDEFGNAIPIPTDVSAKMDQVEAAQKALEDFDAGLTKNKSTYATLGDVPKDVAKHILGIQDSKAQQELQQAWDVWKTQRKMVGFPEEALKDADTFKAYLKQRMGQEWGEASSAYNRYLWEVEQFEDAMLSFHTGDDLAATVFPRVHESQISNGMKTFIRNQEGMISNYEQARRALDTWSGYMQKMATEGHPAALLSKEDAAALKAWAYGDGTKSKAEMLDIILHGNKEKNITGAIDKVNHVMLDYQTTNVTDQFMKNFFPFWMFPSRSFPFWAETLATHPQIIAGYEKLQALSRSQRYQAGAVTSQGKPLPSLDGYIQIPGTDSWFNPLAPFSFRYLLDIQKSKDDIIYQSRSQDDLDPKAYVANELMNTGQIYGFSMSPWTAWLFKTQLGIPDEVMPRYPLLPEIQLIPRWMTQEMVQRLNQVNFFGVKGLGDDLYPEAPWHDYLVERRILENALQQIQSGKLSEDQKLKLMNQAQQAIANKGQNAMWQQTYKDITNDEAARSAGSFFTGMYVKQFGDGQASLLQQRNQINLLKSALNNEFQSEVFNLPTDAETAWTHYLNVQDTPEGWVHRLYTDIGWVHNDQGMLVRDPVERAKWLALSIKQGEQQQMYYDKSAALQKEFNKRLHALPVGADWSQTQLVYDWYAKERSSLDYLRTQEKYYGTNKPVELIQQDLAKDWFADINRTKPQWDISSGETYDVYQARVAEWEQNLPKMAPLYMRAYMRRSDLVSTLGALHEDQQFNTAQFFQQLTQATTKEGLDQFDKQNDDVFAALNKAWKATYWDAYWTGVIGKSGYEVDLAENNFYTAHPNPPSADELYQWISNNYGPGKFTPDEIKKYVDGTDELDIMQRQLEKQADPVDYTKRQEIWDMLSWVGPGNKNRDVFNTAFVNAGGDPDMLTTWYQENGQAYKTLPEKLDVLNNAIQSAIKTLGMKPPAHAELVRYVQAQNENEDFQRYVTAELGNQFFDYTDETGKAQQGVYSYYNNLSKEQKKEFRANNPDEYEAIQNYYDMKDVYSGEHPVWADYYGFDTKPSVSLPTQGDTQSVFTPPALKGYHGGGGGGGGRPTQAPPNSPSYSNSNNSNYLSSYFNINDRTSNYISPGLYQLAGNKLAWEITNVFSTGKKISPSGVSFLKSIASRYPNYASEISRILQKGT